MQNKTQLFASVLTDALKHNKRFLLKRPDYIATFAAIARTQKARQRIREKLLEQDDLVVPPILILSVTNDCNLSCAGCYACSQQRNTADVMSRAEMERVVAEAVDLGTSVVMVAGGEPLMKDGVWTLAKKHPRTVFVLFTNGLLLDDNKIAELKTMKNLIPILSLEGDEVATDKRRGNGIYKKVTHVMQKMNDCGCLFGTSVTLTSQTYNHVVKNSYLQGLQDIGCRTAFLIEYVPNGDDTHLCLTEEQKKHLRQTNGFKHLNMLTVPLPGDEEKYGGCLAAGRGFLHISSTGALEACPFAPYSDINIKKMPLKQALKSRLLAEIRDKHHLLTEAKGGCALNENKQWINELMV